MTHREHGLTVATQCQALARALAPYQNRGDTVVIDAPKIPPSALLMEMNGRINVIRAEYGMPAVHIGPMLTVEQITELTSALISAGNMLQQLYNEKGESK